MYQDKGYVEDILQDVTRNACMATDAIQCYQWPCNIQWMMKKVLQPHLDSSNCVLRHITFQPDLGWPNQGFETNDKLFVNMKKCAFGYKELDYLGFLCEPWWTKHWSNEVFSHCYLATTKYQPWSTLFQENGELSQELYFIVFPWHGSSQWLQAPRIWNLNINSFIL